MSILVKSSLFFLLLCGLTPAEELNLIIGREKQQKMRYGIDYERLWYWTDSLDAEERDSLAKWSVVDTEVDYIRVAINAGYELKEGQFNLRAYTKKIIPMMKEMKEANPDIKFFASPRPADEAEKGISWQPYPRWITGDHNKKGKFDLDWEKCAEYLLRYLELMHSQGFKISFLDITNEWQSSSGNNGRLTTAEAQKIVTYLKKKLPPNQMPLIVAPSSWNYTQGASWLKTINTPKKRAAIDIASSHNTNRTGTPAQFAAIARRELGDDIEIWNTELHGWKSTSKENEITSFYYNLELIRAGFSGINGWLALGTPKQGHSYIYNSKGKPVRNAKYFLFKKLSVTSNYGHALNIVSQPSELSYTAALIKENLMTVWTVNKSNEELPLKITPKKSSILENGIRRTLWIKPEDVKGTESRIKTADKHSFSSVLPPQSVCCFEILLSN